LETFEFIVEGPPVSLKAKKTNNRRYRRWIKTVSSAAQARWPVGKKPATSTVTVNITNYYTLSPPDVDNIIKPLLDALNGIVYIDDQQVYKVISEKVDLSSNPRIENPSALLAEALGKYTELLFIVAAWEEED